MPETPNIYLDAPDPLSVLLSKLSLSAEIYVNGDFCGTWAVDTGGSKRIPFHLVGSGTAWLHLGGSKPQILSNHDLIIFPHDAHHVISSSPDTPAADQVNAPMSNDGEVTNIICGFFEFRNPVLFPVLDSLPQIMLLKSDSGETGERIEFLISLMIKELKNTRPGFYTVIDQMAFLIFIEVLRKQMDNDALGDGLLRALFDARLGRALNAIHQRAELSWTLDSLAKEALMSRSSFADTFSKIVGLSPMKYLTRWRMNEARRLLQTTQLSVAQIAEKSGYESDAAFRKAYRNTLGETPGSVRTKNE
ncbi:MAG: AraC family transcriptional regulator [Oceanicoccus sp.]